VRITLGLAEHTDRLLVALQATFAELQPAPQSQGARP